MASKPQPLSAATPKQLPVVPIYRANDRKADVDAILEQHARGLFARPAQLCDELMTDDRIFGVVQTRIGALMSAELEIAPAQDGRQERKLKQLLGGEDDAREQGLWSEICPAPVLYDLLYWGLLLGVAVAQVVWRRTADAWVPRVIPWHPQWLRWDWAARRFAVTQLNGNYIMLPDIDEQPESDGNWIIWTPHGQMYPWRGGLIRCLAEAYTSRRWTSRDWDRHGERHGMAILKGMVPQWAQDEDVDEFLNSLSNIGSDAALICRQGATKEAGSYDVDMVEAEAKTWETFKERKAGLDVDIAVAILGQNLTTEGGGSQGGSRALGQVHDLVRIDKALEDAKIGPMLRRQLLGWWAFYNYGDPKLAPTINYLVEPPTDQLKEASALKMMGDALQSLELAEQRVDVVAILDAQGVPLLTEEELQAKLAVEAEERAAREAEAAANAQTDGADQSGDGGDEGAGAGDGEPAPNKAQARARALLTTLPRRRTFCGLPIVVEHPADSIRIHKGPSGEDIPVKMLFDYGFIEGYTGGDGEELDCYLGPDENAPDVHVVHQLRAPDFRAHDEDKVMLGFPSADMARGAYLAHRRDGRALSGMSVIPVDRFKAKLRRRAPDTTSKIRAGALEALRIVHKNDGWHVYSEDGSKHLGGPYATKQEAIDRLKQVEHYKSARADVMGALMALARRASGAPGGAGRGKVNYQERLRKRAQELAARALAVDLAGIKEEIDAATSFEDLRRRVLARFRGMNPKRLAEIVRKTNLLGHLSGRFDAVGEV